MSCSGCGPSKYSIEFHRRFKPESNSGCCVKAENNCKTPSVATKDSALWNWEQIHGKLIETYSVIIGSDGRYTMVFEKTACPKTSTRKDRPICCSIRYKISR